MPTVTVHRLTLALLAGATIGALAAQDAHAACAITEIRGDVAACADANTIDARDGAMPDIGPPCDFKAGEDCRPFARRLMTADMSALDGFAARRVTLTTSAPFGFKTVSADGNIAYPERIMGTQPHRADGYGHWMARRLDNLTGKPRATHRAVEILDAMRDGDTYRIKQGAGPRATLSETRDLASGATVRRVWVSIKGEETVLRVNWTPGSDGYTAVLRKKDRDGATRQHAFDQNGDALADAGTVPTPLAVYAEAQMPLAIAAMAANTGNKAPSPTDVAGSYSDFVPMPEGSGATDKSLAAAIRMLNAGNDAGASAELLIAMIGAPKDARPELLLGLMYLRQRSDTAAAAALFKSWRKDKTSWRCNLARAVVNERLGRMPQARGQLKIAAERAPDEPVVRYYLAQAALADKDEATARRHLEKIFKVD